MGGRLTLKQVAEHFSVSVNTVSRALNDKYGVNEDLRARIKAYAAEHNYVPNMFGRGLRGEKTALIGVIIADTRNPAYFDEMIAIEQAAANEGYSILLCNSHENIATEQKNLHVMVEKNVDGVLIVPCGYGENEPPNDFSILEQFRIPFVLMHRYIEGHDYDFVGFDNTAVGETALGYLLAKGRRDIMFLMPPNTNTSIMERVCGYRKAYAKLGMELSENSMIKVDMSKIDPVDEAVTRLFVSNLRCDAILTYNDLMALGAMRAIKKLNLRIPEDIAVMSVDDITFASTSIVPLSTIHLDSAMLGRRAASILFDKLRGVSSSQKKEILRTYLVERGST